MERICQAVLITAGPPLATGRRADRTHLRRRPVQRQTVTHHAAPTPVDTDAGSLPRCTDPARRDWPRQLGRAAGATRSRAAPPAVVLADSQAAGASLLSAASHGGYRPALTSHLRVRGPGSGTNAWGVARRRLPRAAQRLTRASGARPDTSGSESGGRAWQMDFACLMQIARKQTSRSWHLCR